LTIYLELTREFNAGRLRAIEPREGLREEALAKLPARVEIET